MDIMQIFLTQFLMSTLVFALLAYWLAVPWLNTKPTNEALFVLLIPHAFRHIGLSFLVPGVVDQPLPATFAGPAAYGDLAAGILALIALIALRYDWGIAIILVWIFSVVGTIDFANALRQTDAAAGMGATWYIPTILVPFLLVTQALVFTRLLSRRRQTVAVPA